MDMREALSTIGGATVFALFVMIMTVAMVVADMFFGQIPQ